MYPLCSPLSKVDDIVAAYSARRADSVRSAREGVFAICVVTRNIGVASPSIFVYDSLDVGEEALAQWDFSFTFGVPERATGKARPKMNAEELVAAARGHDALLGASGALITREVFGQLPELRYVAKLGIGHEVIDIEAASDHGVVVINTPIHSEVDLVAEHAIALMLTCVKQFHWYNTDYIRRGGWRHPDYFVGSLFGSVVGIIGYGNIGRAVAQRLGAFGVRVLAYDVRDFDDDSVATRVSLEELLTRADVVTLHAPSTGAEPLLNVERLRMMKRGALLINTARGKLVDTLALRELLESGHLAGFGADVFFPEPPPSDDALLAAPSVYLTPHVAAWNSRVREEMVSMALSSLHDLFAGACPSNVVNPEVFDKGVRE